MFFRKRKERLNKEERSQIVRIISSYAKSKGKMTVAPSIDIEDAMRLVIEFFLGKRWLEIYNENPELTVNEAICIILTMDELRPFRKKFLKIERGINMFKGTLYLTYDPNMCMKNLQNCKTIIIADEPDMYNIPGKIGASILLPPYQALAAVIDGDEEKFSYEYMLYLNTDQTVNRFINIILQALIAGTNIILLLDMEGPKFDMILKQYFLSNFGIIIGDAGYNFSYDIQYIPNILSKLYGDGDINAEYFLKLYPEDAIFSKFILGKLQYDTDTFLMNEEVAFTYFKKFSKILKSGGQIRNVVQRLG